MSTEHRTDAPTHPGWDALRKDRPHRSRSDKGQARGPVRPQGAFGIALAAALATEGRSQRGLATAIGVQSAAINALVTDRRRPSLWLLHQIVRELPRHRDTLITAAFTSSRKSDFAAKPRGWEGTS